MRKSQFISDPNHSEAYRYIEIIKPCVKDMVSISLESGELSEKCLKIVPVVQTPEAFELFIGYKNELASSLLLSVILFIFLVFYDLIGLYFVKGDRIQQINKDWFLPTDSCALIATAGFYYFYITRSVVSLAVVGLFTVLYLTICTVRLYKFIKSFRKGR